MIGSRCGPGIVHLHDEAREAAWRFWLATYYEEAGIDIARRTVAKYREALRIPSSVERKRMLKTG